MAPKKRSEKPCVVLKRRKQVLRLAQKKPQGFLNANVTTQKDKEAQAKVKTFLRDFFETHEVDKFSEADVAKFLHKKKVAYVKWCSDISMNNMTTI